MKEATADNNIAKSRRSYTERSGEKFTQEDAARFVGVSLTTYRNWEQQKNLPDARNAVLLAKKYGVSIDYLLGNDSPIQAQPFVDVPLYDMGMKGVPTLVGQNKSAPQKFIEDDPECFFVRVHGNAMSHTVQNGSYALISPKRTIPNERDMFLLKLNSGETIIRKLHGLENGVELLPDSYDPTFRPMVVDFENNPLGGLKIIGTVIWHCAAF